MIRAIKLDKQSELDQDIIRGIIFHTNKKTYWHYFRHGHFYAKGEIDKKKVCWRCIKP